MDESLDMKVWILKGSDKKKFPLI